MDLNKAVKDYEDLGCTNHSSRLGFVSMPKGYALMLNADNTHYFWLRHDGAESFICCDKWGVYRGALNDSKTNV